MEGDRTSQARTALGAAGVVLVGVGGWQALGALTLPQLLGLALWLAAAVIVHDGIISPLVALLTALLRRAGRRLPRMVEQVIIVGFVTGAVLTLVVLPEVAAQAQGNANPTVLPGDYAAKLGWVWLLVLVVTVGTAATAWVRHRVSTVRAS